MKTKRKSNTAIKRGLTAFFLKYPNAKPKAAAEAVGCCIKTALLFKRRIGTPLNVLEDAARQRAVAEAAKPSAGAGVKHDQGKLPWHLLPGDAIDPVLRVLDYGATKYAPRNWEAGMDWSRPFGAMMRHMWAWWMGEDKDKETGESHLAHAACCLLFLLAYEQRRIGNDDRSKL